MAVLTVCRLTKLDRISIPRDTRIIGLGEANHGTREFQILKHKLAKYLIQNHELNVIVFEFPFSDGLLLNDYVLGLNDSGIGILTGRKNSEYNNRAFIDFIEDIRNLNSSKEESKSIQFLGSDIFGKPSAVKQLMGYLHKHDSIFVKKIKKYETLSENLYVSAFQQDKKEFKQLSRIILKRLEINKKLYLTSSSALKYSRMVRLAEILAIEWKGNRRAKEWSNNIFQILDENPNNKIFFFGHNIHIGTFYKREVGHYIKQKYENYFTIGTDYNSGSFMAKNLKDRKNPVPGILDVIPMKNSFADHLSAYTGDFHFLRLPTDENESTQWLSETNYIARIGFGFIEPFTRPEQGREVFVLTKSIDAMIVFDSITPTNLLNDKTLLKKRHE